MTDSTTDRTGPVPIVVSPVRWLAARRGRSCGRRLTAMGGLPAGLEKSTVAVDPGEGPQDDVSLLPLSASWGDTPARQDT